MKRLSAHYLFDGINLIKFGVLEIDDDGTILSVSKAADNLKEISGLSFYNGILMPGMINMHCHLELSDLHKAIPENTGLSGFIAMVNNLKSINKAETKLKSIEKADNTMYVSGIASVADVCNSDISLNTKLKSNIYYHNFIECIGIRKSDIFKKLTDCKLLLDKFNNAGLSTSLTPHAIYSLHPELFKTILDLNNNIFSLHFFESNQERELYNGVENSLLSFLNNIDYDYKIPDIGLSLSDLKNSMKNANMVLVHNVDLQEDICYSMYSSENVFPCLCPNSNIFISDKIPDIDNLMKLSNNIVVGTDSLASNHNLSLIAELYSISKFYPDIPIVELLKWVSSNGAKALGLQQKFGNFTIGTKPGVVLLSNIDLKKLSITPKTYSRRII